MKIQFLYHFLNQHEFSENVFEKHFEYGRGQNIELTIVRLSKNPIKNLVSKLMKAYVVPERREDNSGESMRTTFQDSGTIKNMLSGFKNTLLALKDAVWI